MSLKKRFVAASAFFFLIPLTALGTDGYFASGQGVACKAMGGACTALYLDTIAPAVNPAAIAFLPPRYDIAVDIFNPNRDYTIVGAPSGQPRTFGLAPGKVKSSSTVFAIPALGANWKFSDRTNFGVAVYGNGGMNTNYRAQTFGFSPTGVDLAQLFIAPTAAVKIAPHQALGITGIAAYQRFRAEGLQAFAPFSSDAANLTNNRHDSSWGFGGRVGYLGEFGMVAVGASYQAKLSMGKFGKYAGLFAGGGGFDIPANYRAGLAVKPFAGLTFSGDYERILYSGVRSVGNPLFPNLGIARLGDNNGAGFGWKDISVWKLGAAYAVTPALTVRGGYSSNSQPIPSSEVLFNILAPGVIEKHVTAGLSFKGRGPEWNLTVVRALSQKVSGPNPLEVPGQQRIDLRMDQWEFAVGMGFGF